MATARYRCVVCGRPFPEGQGIVIRRGDLVLAFHSSRCASKFLRLLMERADAKCLEGPAREVLRDLEQAEKARSERSKKVIA